jgi:hypothetical protein
MLSEVRGMIQFGCLLPLDDFGKQASKRRLYSEN